jgi:hypothetical protein
MNMNMIVPPLAQTAITGFRGACERMVRSVTYRCDVYTDVDGNPTIVMFRNGGVIDYRLNATTKALANAAWKFFSSAPNAA